MNWTNHLKSKNVDLATAKKKINAWRATGQRIVFTNGCFDILHYGHIHYLAEARNLGDRLVIGLNSDASVSALKGANRPIQDVESRAFVIAALGIVDLVVVFEESTPLKLIESIKPDVFVKGGDYTVDSIVGADFVLKRGGEVQVLPFVEGYSTTAIEEKIRDKEPKEPKE